MNDERIITLTTDFGYRDPFAGEMKGVILSINPAARIVDITHGIEPQDVEQGSFIIGSSYKYFPEGTIHVCVVDPGVGSARRAIIIEAGGHYFIGPDNGLFSHVVAFSRGAKAVHITEKKCVLDMDSPTFQGRDVFAPAAAWLSRGVKIGDFGPAINDFKRLAIPAPVIGKDYVTGAVIYRDRFGNAVTNITKSALSSLGESVSGEVKSKAIRLLKYYSQAEAGELACLVNSSGYLELFVNKGNAATMFDIKRGERVIVRAIIIPK